MSVTLSPDLRAFLDTAEEAAVVVHAAADGAPGPLILLVNRRAAALTGHDPAALAGRSLRRLRGDGPREPFARLLAAIEARSPFEGPVTLASARGPDLALRARLQHPPGLEAVAILWLAPDAADAAAPDPAGLVRQAGPWSGLASDGLYLLAVDDVLQQRLVWGDARFQALLGQPPGAPPLARGPAGLALPADRDVLRARDQRLLAGQESTVRYRIGLADGTVRAVRDATRPIADGRGIVRLVAGALAEVADEPAEAPARGLLERMAGVLARRRGDLVGLVDGRGRVRWASAGLAESLGGSLGGSSPHALEGLLGEREQDRWLELVDRALAEAAPVEGRLDLPGGEPLLASLSPLGEGLLLAFLRVLGAERREAAGWHSAPAGATAGLAEAAAAPPIASTPLLDAVAAALLGIDAQGRIRLANEAAARLLAVDRAELLDRPIEAFLSGAESEAALRVLLLEQLPRERGVRELQGRREQAEPLPLEVAACRVRGPGEPLVLLTLRDATLARHTEETLRTLAYLDPLTGLPNRLLFMDRLGQAIARARRARQLLAVMLVDLDRFKLVNDSLGLERGDQLLKAVGERLVGTLRRSDTVARLSSDEFVVLLTGLEQPDPIVKVAHKLLQALQAPLSVNGHELSPTASIGVAVYPHDGDEPAVLVKNADTALGRAKELGRSHVQFYTNDMNAQAFERLMLENRLRRALENGELAVYYQPQVSLRTGEVVGVEALVRWFHPELGLVPPGEFIPLAEETGLILPIGFWAMETACSQVQVWRMELDRPGLRLAVNLSARQFQHPELATRIAEILERTAFPATSLELELTESVVMREASESMRRMRELTLLGAALAIDDFGTGYSSLAYLRSFPIRSLKIDRSFVQDVDRDPSSATIVQAIVAMGASLGLTVVAEGVETSQQLRQLRRMGCHEMQGFLVSRALPADEVVAVIRDGRLEGEEFLLADGG
mgnify:CR=1 FL=1